jgi:DNA-binding XRE family transcriptional regulator
MLSPDELKSIRKTLGFTQEKTASLIGCPISTYAKWEQGLCIMPHKKYRKSIGLLIKYAADIQKSLDKAKR